MLSAQVDIVASILEFSHDGIPKIELQKKLAAEPDVFDEYLEILMAKEMIMITTISKSKSANDTKVVKTTDRGIKFFDMYKTIKLRYLTVPGNS